MLDFEEIDYQNDKVLSINEYVLLGYQLSDKAKNIKEAVRIDHFE